MNNKIPLVKLPLRLKAAALFLALHLLSFVWFSIVAYRGGAPVHPSWVWYVLLCLFVFPEVRNARLAAMVVLVGFCLLVPSCMMAVEYDSIKDDQDVQEGFAILFVPVYVSALLVLSVWKFYRPPQVAGHAP